MVPDDNCYLIIKSPQAEMPGGFFDYQTEQSDRTDRSDYKDILK
jgi:hypothetical protein